MFDQYQNCIRGLFENFVFHDLNLSPIDIKVLLVYR